MIDITTRGTQFYISHAMLRKIFILLVYDVASIKFFPFSQNDCPEFIYLFERRKCITEFQRRFVKLSLDRQNKNKV